MKKIFKKSISLLAAAVLLLVALFGVTGCDGFHKAKKTSTFEIPDTFDETQHYEITFWAKNDSNKTQVAIYEQAIADFQALYPNITVTLRKYTDYQSIYNDVITNISTNTTPNVCITYPDHIATYKTGQNVVVTLDDLMTDKKYGLGGSEVKFDSPKKSEIVTEFLEECKLDGNYYALPYLRSTEALYVNKDFVEALGYELPEMVTWDFIWEVSEKAMEKNEDGTFKLNGQKVLIPFIYKSTDNMMISYLKQANAGFSNANGDVFMFNDTTSEFLKEISKHADTKSFSTFKISSYPGNYLNAGQCIFAIDSTAGATWMGSSAPLLDIHSEDVQPYTCEVLPIPQVDTENPKMISQGPSVCVFNKENPQEVLASWLFAQFLLTNEVQIPYAQTEGYVPVTKKAQSTAEYQDYLNRAGDESDPALYYDIKIKATKLLLNNTANTFVTAVFNGSADLRNVAGELIEDVTKSTRRKITVDDAYLDNLYETMISRYNLKVATEAGGELPSTAVWMIVLICAAWVGIITTFIIRKIKAKKK